MSIFTGMFRSRDKPQNRTAGSSYSFFFGGSTSGKRKSEMAHQAKLRGRKTVGLHDSWIPGKGWGFRDRAGRSGNSAACF